MKLLMIAIAHRVLITWYEWHYESLSRESNWYLTQLIRAHSSDEKAAYRAELVDVLRRRGVVFSKLTEVRDVHSK